MIRCGLCALIQTRWLRNRKPYFDSETAVMRYVAFSYNKFRLDRMQIIAHKNNQQIYVDKQKVY